MSTRLEVAGAALTPSILGEAWGAELTDSTQDGAQTVPVGHPGQVTPVASR